MADTDELVIVSHPREKLRYVVPGSGELPCSECGLVVVVSPSSYRLINSNPGTRVVCIGCAVALARDRGQGSLVLAPGQAQEIQAYFRRQ